ncbi:hypothetical protein AYO40_02985 [Planctomycetaceae bacterium SCGC AG-212-D15]|nr:hypothetical protein AYO40_02985 [Planctomycetaceae bacterium SCGC AG-212-D15]
MSANQRYFRAVSVDFEDLRVASRRLLVEGATVEEVAASTGFSREAVEVLAEELKKFERKEGIRMYPERFEISGHHGYFRPAGIMSLDEAVERINAAIAVAREYGVRKLLVETRALRGFDSPSLASRYGFIREWAATARQMVRLAVVARPEMVEPGKFGVKVARKAGLVADVFTSEEEAAAWLDSGMAA